MRFTSPAYCALMNSITTCCTAIVTSSGRSSSEVGDDVDVVAGELVDALLELVDALLHRLVLLAHDLVLRARRSSSLAPTGSGSVRASDGTVMTATAPTRATSSTAAATAQARLHDRLGGCRARPLRLTSCCLTYADTSGTSSNTRVGWNAFLRSLSSPTSRRVSS